jgi:hypothetical protein
MINPNEEDFTKDPLMATPLRTDRPLGEGEENFADVPAIPPLTGDVWQQAKTRAGQARERTEVFVRENPVPIIIGALGIGLAIGWALRHAIGSEENETEIKPKLGNVNWSLFSLPFLWPVVQSLKERYEDSAESVKEGVGRLKKIDISPYTKPIRKSWKAWRD